MASRSAVVGLSRRSLSPLLLLVGLLALATSAYGSERVVDGGFDALTTCNPDPPAACTNPAWTQATEPDDLQVPICESGIGVCGQYGDGPLSQLAWAQLGARSEGPLADDIWSIQQVVQIPAAPATLTFQLRIQPSLAAHGTLVARLDGAPIFGAADSTPGFASYASVRVDVSGFAGSPRVLSFEGATHNVDMGGTGTFNLDDVSLEAPNVASTPAPPAGTPRKCGRRKKGHKRAAHAAKKRKCKGKRKKARRR
jgi:hypothetical protein